MTEGFRQNLQGDVFTTGDVSTPLRSGATGMNQPMIAATLKSQRGKDGGGLGPEETLVALDLTSCGKPRHPRPPHAIIGCEKGCVTECQDAPDYRSRAFYYDDGDGHMVKLPRRIAAPLSHGSNPNSNMAGRRREDDENLVSYNWLSVRDASEHVDALSKSQVPAVGVRRLTPRECEALQALPPDWTAHGPDSRRYAALGDAVTASVAEWIGRRLVAA